MGRIKFCEKCKQKTLFDFIRCQTCHDVYYKYEDCKLTRFPVPVKEVVVIPPL